MIKIDYAPPEDRDAIVSFMENAFSRAKWARDGWESILSGRWSAPGDNYAVTAKDGDKLIGVIGLIPSHRPTEGGMVKILNLTSWYIDKTYRGQRIGTRVMELAMSDPTAMTATNLTSAKGALSVVAQVGFDVLDDMRMVWRHSGGPGLPIHDDPLAQDIPKQDRRVLTDHIGLDLRTVAVETPDGFCVLIISVKRKHDSYITFETMYIGNRALFSRHARAIADSILPPSDAVLSVDSRFVTPGTQADATEVIEVPRFYKAGRMPAADVDHLYSEIVLLGQKMY